MPSPLSEIIDGGDVAAFCRARGYAPRAIRGTNGLYVDITGALPPGCRGPEGLRVPSERDGIRLLVLEGPAGERRLFAPLGCALTVAETDLRLAVAADGTVRGVTRQETRQLDSSQRPGLVALRVPEEGPAAVEVVYRPQAQPQAGGEVEASAPEPDGDEERAEGETSPAPSSRTDAARSETHSDAPSSTEATPRDEVGSPSAEASSGTAQAPSPENVEAGAGAAGASQQEEDSARPMRPNPSVSADPAPLEARHDEASRAAEGLDGEAAEPEAADRAFLESWNGEPSSDSAPANHPPEQAAASPGTGEAEVDSLPLRRGTTDLTNWPSRTRSGEMFAISVLQAAYAASRRVPDEEAEGEEQQRTPRVVAEAMRYARLSTHYALRPPGAAKRSIAKALETLSSEVNAVDKVRVQDAEYFVAEDPDGELRVFRTTGVPASSNVVDAIRTARAR